MARASGEHTPEGIKLGSVSQRSVDSAADAFYRRAAAASDDARARAQTGFTMASIIAGAVFGGGVAAHVSRAALVTQIVAFAAFAAWLLSALRLLVAAVGEYTRPDEDGDRKGVQTAGDFSIAQDDQAFMQVILNDVVNERNFVYDRLKVALALVPVAIALTAAAGALALWGPSVEDKTGAVALSVDAQRAVAAVCHDPLRPTVVATYKPIQLSDHEVELKLERSQCSSGPLAIRVPSADLTAASSTP